MAWLWLITAGVLEIAWAVALKASHGFTRLGPSLWMLVTLVASFLLLARAVRELPVGTAYAVWTGIGAAGTAIVGMLVLGEPRDPLRLACIALIVAGTVGLRLLGGE